MQFFTSYPCSLSFNLPFATFILSIPEWLSAYQEKTPFSVHVAERSMVKSKSNKVRMFRSQKGELHPLLKNLPFICNGFLPIWFLNIEVTYLLKEALDLQNTVWSVKTWCLQSCFRQLTFLFVFFIVKLGITVLEIGVPSQVDQFSPIKQQNWMSYAYSQKFSKE